MTKQPPIVQQDAGEAMYERRAVDKARKRVGPPIDGFMLGIEHYTIDIVQALEYLVGQAYSDSKRWFPEIADSLQHMVLALCGEAGETANALKKGMRKPETYDLALENVAGETIDVFIYLLNIWAILGIDPAHELAIKRALNEERFGPEGGEQV